MAKQTISVFRPKDKVNRKGVEAKTKTSKNKDSKNYKKPYRGQGRWEAKEVDKQQAGRVQENHVELVCAMMVEGTAVSAVRVI